MTAKQYDEDGLDQLDEVALNANLRSAQARAEFLYASQLPISAREDFLVKYDSIAMMEFLSPAFHDSSFLNTKNLVYVHGTLKGRKP